jgi:hypothetical protein
MSSDDNCPGQCNMTGPDIAVPSRASFGWPSPSKTDSITLGPCTGTYRGPAPIRTRNHTAVNLAFGTGAGGDL